MLRFAVGILLLLNGVAGGRRLLQCKQTSTETESQGEKELSAAFAVSINNVADELEACGEEDAVRKATAIVNEAAFNQVEEFEEEDAKENPQRSGGGLRAAQVKFAEGRTENLKFMSHLWNPIHSFYRPMCFDLLMEFLGILAHSKMNATGFVQHQHAGYTYFTILRAWPERVHSTCFIDPVYMGMFFPILLSTFVYSPAQTNTWEYVLKDMGRMPVCKEVGIASTMCRGFAWSNLNVWPDNLPENKSLVVFSGQDILVPGAELKRILEVCGTKTNIMWHDDLSGWGVPDASLLENENLGRNRYAGLGGCGPVQG
ncbi:hypothetical protein BSKO_05880 [Bryopsis sp. KO-2023]|nr:hypothetical protein BSKO_05880 [Bryopsis sp. KO-2023]